MPTAAAPRASATRISVPRRTPPSSSTGDAAGDGVDDPAQCVEGGDRAVELAAAVVADDDAGGAVLDGEARVLGVQDAFEDDGASEGGEPLEVLPLQAGDERDLRGVGGRDPRGGGDVREVHAGGDREADADVALAATEALQVDGEDQGLVAEVDRALDHRPARAGVGQ